MMKKPYLVVFLLPALLFLPGCSQDSTARRDEIYSAGRESTEENIKIVSLALDDADPQVRVAALTMWSSLKEEESTDELRRALGDPHGLVRTVAAKLVAEWNDPESKVLLQQLAVSDRDRWVRLRAVEALGSYRSEDTIPTLQRALEDPDAEIRRAAIGGLRKLGPAVPVESLIEVLSVDVDWEVRVRAARALAGRGDPSARAALEAAVSDASEFVRAAAIRSLNQEVIEPPPGLMETIREGSAIEVTPTEDGSQ